MQSNKEKQLVDRLAAAEDQVSNLQSREFLQDRPLQHYSRAHGPTGHHEPNVTCRPMSSGVVLQRTILRELPRLKIGCSLVDALLQS